MSNKSTIISASKAATDSSNDEAFKAGSKAKAFYQYFTSYFIAILLICTISSSITLMFAYQQNKQSQTLINEQLTPLQIQFRQQSYLIKSNNLIDDILQNTDVEHLISLQQKLLLQSKKLALLQSQHNSYYQQWFRNNNVATNLVKKIESNHISNELLKSKGLIQLDTLLDAIEIQLNNSEVDEKAIQVLTTVKNSLSKIVTRLQRLSMQTSFEEFDQLQVQIDELFIADYGKILSSQQRDNLAMTEIVRDFIHFEDMVLKRGLLMKWQAYLRLMEGYQHQLMSGQQQLKNILIDLSEYDQTSNNSLSNGIVDISKAIAPIQLPTWIWISFALTLMSITLLLWFTRLRIKISSQQNVDYVSHALAGGSTSLNNQDKIHLTKNNEAGLYCAESYLLIDKIQQLNENRFSEAEYLAIVDKNLALEGQAVKNQVKQAHLKLALEQAGINATENSKRVHEQQYCENLHLAAINQLVLLGCSAVSTSKNAKANSELVDENYLYQAYKQGCDLVRQLRQKSCMNYLHSSDSVLTLSDENFITQIQGILLNSAEKFALAQNKVSLQIDEKIQAVANLDAQLFDEMFRGFIKLLLSHQTQQTLLLSLKLVDKNNGQQIISFSGQVIGEKRPEQLPQRLESFNESDSEQSEVTDYFIVLLQYQHGENISANLTEQGYQLSFTMPLAVTNTKQEQCFSAMTFPVHLPTIEQALTKLKANYLDMPIEVLLAVKSPEQYQRLQQLLQGMGLQVLFVTSERMLEHKWHTGRFAVLMTEFAYTPFTRFMKSDYDTTQECASLPRGVFTLEGALPLEAKEEFSHWSLGQLTANSSIDELMKAMLPWIKEHDSATSRTEKRVIVNRCSERDRKAAQAANNVPAITKKPTSFNFERYLKHQGSAELALYMLDEYMAENKVLVQRLSTAFYANDVDNAVLAVKALVVNGKILAAENLLHLCELWQKLLTKQGIENRENIQISLLNKTKQAVEAINLYADAIA